MKKYAFLDRDGVLIYEPQDDYQIDSLEKLNFLPGVIEGLKNFIKKKYFLIMISNQDGLGTKSFPKKDFDLVQNKMIEIFEKNEIKFEEIFICPHFPEENCQCRKPKTGLVNNFFKTSDIDMKKSFMYGDRESDREFAENIGIKFIKVETNKPFNINLINL